MKKIIITATLIILIGITSLCYSYWDTLQNKEIINIPIGKATTLLVSITDNVPEGKTLIPADAIQGINNVSSVDLKYSVKLDKETVSTPTLSVVASNIKIGGDETYSDFIVITIVKPETISFNAVDVTVSVSLKNQSEGITEDIYNSINSKSITFDLTFSAIV